MSVRIGSTKGPNHNSPWDVADVWADRSGVSLNLFEGTGSAPPESEKGTNRRLDPVAARNLAALLVRGADEVERMRSIDQSARGYVGGGRHEPGGTLDPHNRDKG